ncbi:MAG: Fe-S protein assembly co-chaperone HscB [Alphaproteobacteria bacterium]|nr:Fe-S protein assembly co-chaperone HscB [Alphaproteobacteria bacterium]
MGDADYAFCSTCGAVQPPLPITHFQRLGLASGFQIPRDQLDAAYFDQARRLHPDRFATRTPRERQFSQAQAVSLNEAYETLKDPLRCALYLLTLAGRSSIAQERTIRDPTLLMEAMEAREALEEATDLAAVEALAARQRADRDSCLASLQQLFDAGDLDGAEAVTLRLTYLAKLGEDIRLRRMRLAMSA